MGVGNFLDVEDNVLFEEHCRKLLEGKGSHWKDTRFAVLLIPRDKLGDEPESGTVNDIKTDCI